MRGIIRLAVLMLVCLCWAGYVHAQAISHATDTSRNNVRQIHQAPPKKIAAIKHEVSVGFRLNTNGWSAYSDIAKIKPLDTRRSDMFYKARVLQIELTEKKDPKEEKITSEVSNSTSGSSKYIYGKINNFYALKLGLGFRKMIAGKPDPGAVSIHWLNLFGVSLGMLKPYYLNVYSDPSAIKYNSSTQADFLNQQVIEGNAGFSKGLGEMKFIPGIHFKSALHFDFSTNKKNAIAAETGINVEYYSSAVTLMANESGTPYFVDLFIALQFGRRW